VEKAGVVMVTILWVVVVILVAPWLIGLVARVAGGRLAILLVVAVIIAASPLRTGRRAV
jgi:hypothetical protein